MTKVLRVATAQIPTFAISCCVSSSELILMEFEIPTHVLESVRFRLYNKEDILALSVKEITNPQTFDTLSHPTIGGLYDPALGPTDRDDVCATCGQNFVHCPGHMGHISLPLPTLNPVYFKTFYQILKGSCFFCHRLAIRSIASFIFAKKLVLVENGLLAAVSELEEVVSGLLEEAQNLAEVEETIVQKVNDLFRKSLKEEDGIKVSTKNIEAVKSAIQRDFLSNHFVVKGKCPHCKKKRASIRHEHQSRLLVTGNITPSVWEEEEEKGGVGEKEVGLTEVEANTNSLPDNDDDDDDESPTEKSMQRGGDTPTTGKKPVTTTVTFVTVAEVRNHLRLVWQSDSVVLKALFRSLADSNCDFPTDIFFLDVVAVPPSRFRPISVMNGNKYENPQSANLVRILSDTYTIRQLLQYRKETKEGGELDILPSSLSDVPGKTWIEKFQNAWVNLQTHVNCVVDSDLDKLSRDKHPGIKQLLEKKEGLFRKHMMGKRVNYAARSVISPDPCINTCEIGIPEVFAKKLTYPQTVTPWNIQELRQAVINGPQVHPGACFVVNEDGSKVMLSHKDKTQREAIAKQLLTPGSKKRAVLDCKQVYRHLKNGDVLLLNRQPTLHRPSIQAHKARVLPNEKTLRLHYANCKAYNADFDGDEMNAHFPQNELARSEAYHIACTDYQYLVPKDGTPLAGLIQDHMVSGVWITIRGRFFTHADYCQLVYTALVDKKGPAKLLPPAMIKPHRLWSGKQVLSTIILNLVPEGKKAINLIGKSKIPEKSWPTKNIANNRQIERGLEEMGESHVVIRGGELLCGVLDKGHYGNTPYGLVHCFYELYGGDAAGRLLTCLGRLFMNFLQQLRSFTLGVEDILVTPGADDKRQGAILESQYCGPEAAMKALNLLPVDGDDVVLRALKDAHFDRDDRRLRELDLSMKSKTDDIQNQIIRACMPKGLYRLFPQNNLQLMVQSGAKGSSVNCMQISGLLGQIELEGRRPPLMLSGKTLPSFRDYDTSPRAGGFVSGRFLTGIRPQEYFFHCMAGREGLIDTAVKTSRSGYLQRCLVKHLEGVMVNYDMTVRDTDGSIVQFYYGEDGVDISRAGFLNTKQIPFLLENTTVSSSHEGDKFGRKVAKLNKKIEKWKKKKASLESVRRHSGFLLFCQQLKPNMTVDNTINQNNGRTKSSLKYVKKWRAFSPDDQQVFHDNTLCRCPGPVMSVYRPYQYKGVLPEKYVNTIQQYAKEEAQKLTSLHVSPSEIKDLDRMMFEKCERSLAEPGEAVGMLCAQSIGEPSTQMTLNTFHFAGRGEMNVTLGIPRLREILMVASANIKTPALDIPVINTDSCRTKAKRLQSRLNRVMLSEVLEEVKICEYLSVAKGSLSNRSRLFEIEFHFLPYELYEGKYNITPNSVLTYMEETYIKSLVITIKKKIAQLKKFRLLTSGTVITPHRQQTEEMQTADTSQNDEEDNDLSDQEAGDGDAATEKELRRMDEEKEYEEEGEENPPDIQDVADTDANVAMEMEEGSDAEDLDTESRSGTTSKIDNNDTRVHNVVNSSIHIVSYNFDTKDQQSCKVKLQFGIMNSKLDITSLIEKDVHTAVLYQVPGITRCLLGEEKGQLHLKTEGINIMEMYKYDNILDLNRLYSNDIHAVASQYGIEAASKVIIKEIQTVFAAYGIQVDYRHLSLLADYMTFEGTYKPFNRVAMETSTSPIQKMTFETTMSFLIGASIQGCVDKLRSPSSQLVAGRVVSCGSGTVDIMQPLVL